MRDSHICVKSSTASLFVLHVSERGSCAVGRWLSRAARSNVTEAQYRLGYMSCTGRALVRIHDFRFRKKNTDSRPRKWILIGSQHRLCIATQKQAQSTPSQEGVGRSNVSAQSQQIETADSEIETADSCIGTTRATACRATRQPRRAGSARPLRRGRASPPPRALAPCVPALPTHTLCAPACDCVQSI